MTNFDDLTKLDTHHIFDAIDAQPGHLLLNFADGLRDDLTVEKGMGLKNIVLAGMGGSALPGIIVKNWLSQKLTVPFEVVRSYTLPGYVDETTLVIISSHSGNTEETLAALQQAERRNVRIVVMTAGGELLKQASAKNYSVLELPTGGQPRLTAMAGVKALACLFGDLGLVGGDLRRELEDVASWLNIQKSQWSLDAPDDNQARMIAAKLHNKPALIYAGPTLGAAAYKWKIDINENAKQMANCNVFPELNHNEMQGWLFPEIKPLQAIALHSSLDNERVKKRFIVTRQVLASHGYDPIRVEAPGTTLIQQLLGTILLGDYVSAYLGILNAVDPTPVELVEKFKKELG